MAISGNLTINIGLPNESAGSDSLYTAFNKINTNFDVLFTNASNVVAGNGINIVNNTNNTVISTTTIISTFAGLPTASIAGIGARAFITDGNISASGNFAAQISGGGSNKVPVYSDGTNWLIG